MYMQTIYMYTQNAETWLNFDIIKQNMEFLPF